MSNNMNKNLSVKFWIILTLCCLFFMVLIGIGFYSFANRKKDVIIKDENIGDVTLNYSSNTNGLTILNAVPTTDAVGMKSENYFDFSINSDILEEHKVEYEISISRNNKKSSIPDDAIRIYLEKEENGVYNDIFGPKSFVGLKSDSKIGSKKGEMIIANVSSNKSGIDKYRLRIWMSDKSVLEKGDYSVDVNLYAKVK